jgi:sulfoxide reductase heme-binding subunit YedZ
MIPWVVARATGLVAYGLLTGAMLAGLLVRTRDRAGSLRGAALADLHRHLTLLALALTGVHGLGLLLDRTAGISPLDLLVPGQSPYRPLWTGLGVAAAEAALLVHASSRLRARIGARAWRRIHWLAYAAFAGATAHGIASGSDTGRPWALALYGGAAGAVAALTGWRAATARRGAAAARRPRSGHTGGMGEAAGSARGAGS